MYPKISYLRKVTAIVYSESNLKTMTAIPYKNIKKKANALKNKGISFLSSNYVPNLYFLIYVLDSSKLESDYL